MNNKNTVTRKRITGTARLNMRLPNSNVLLQAEFKGVITRSELERALILAAKKHLLLNSCIAIDVHEAYYDVKKTMIPDIRVEESPVEEVIATALREPFDLAAGPLIRYYLLKKESSSCLVICCHHVICDGLSLVYLLNDIIELIEEKNPEEHYQNTRLTTLDEASIPDSIKNNAALKNMVEGVNKIIAPAVIEVPTGLIKKIHQEFWSDQDNRILKWGLTAAETRKIVEKSRQKKVSVNSIITTMFVRAQQQEIPAAPYTDVVTISANLRNYLSDSPGDTIGFYASAIRPELRYDEGKDFWSNVSLIHLQIKKLLTKESLFESRIIGLFSPKYIDALALAKFDKTDNPMAVKMVNSKKMNSVNTSTTFANLGVINMPQSSGRLAVQSLYGPIVYSDQMEKYIGILTLDKVMYITVSYNARLVSRLEMERIKQAIGCYLLEL